MTNLIDRTLFPSDHCLLVRDDEAPRVVMRRTLFAQLARASDATLERWAGEAVLSLCIPPATGRATLPQPAMLVFKRGELVDTERVSAECELMLCRRAEEEKVAFRCFIARTQTHPLLTHSQPSAARIAELHLTPDILPVMRAATRLIVSPADAVDRLMQLALLSLIQFYQKAPVSSPPVLRQRIFSMDDTKQFLGRICAACGAVTASARRCACLSGVYYCSKDCQRRDWREHRRICATVASHGL
jgi:hypothetical protein